MQVDTSLKRSREGENIIKAQIRIKVPPPGSSTAPPSQLRGAPQIPAYKAPPKPKMSMKPPPPPSLERIEEKVEEEVEERTVPPPPPPEIPHPEVPTQMKVNPPPPPNLPHPEEMLRMMIEKSKGTNDDSNKARKHSRSHSTTTK